MTRDSNLLRDAYDNVYPRGVTGVDVGVGGWPRDRYQVLVRFAGEGTRVLDVGCGDGEVLAALAGRFPALAGVELSANRAANARERLSRYTSNFMIIEGNLEHGLPFSDESFDAVLWADVIEHVVDVFGAMQELARVLARGGRLVTVTPNVAGIRKRLKLMRGRFPSTSGGDEGLAVRDGELFDGGHLHYFTFASVEALYRRVGLVPERRVGFGNFGRLHNVRPTLLSGEVAVVGTKRW